MNGLLIYEFVGTSLLGTILIMLGVILVVNGLRTRAMIRLALAEENASTGAPLEDGTEIQVVDAETAQIRVNQIKDHTLGRLGPFQALIRAKEQESADFFLKGLTIRTALNLAIASFGVANLATATGAALISIGLGTLALGLPLLFWLRP